MLIDFKWYVSQKEKKKRQIFGEKRRKEHKFVWKKEEKTDICVKKRRNPFTQW